jgi:hypothetical protein
MITVIDPRFKNMDLKGSSGKNIFINAHVYPIPSLSFICVSM